MQNFLTFKDLDESARSLDKKRLPNQVGECRQQLNTIYRKRTEPGARIGWVNHPAVKMIENHLEWYKKYIDALVRECQVRGMDIEKNRLEIERLFGVLPLSTGDPAWYADSVTLDRVIISMRGNLYAKNPVAYPQFKEDAEFFEANRASIVTPGQGYFWPNHKDNPVFAY